MARSKTTRGAITPPKAPESAPAYVTDAWTNPYSGYGTSRDRSTSGYYARDLVLQPQELEALYYGDDICATIVDAPIEEAFRNGFDLTADDVALAEDFEDWAEETHDLCSKIAFAETWARLFGGALLVIGADDGQTLDQPLNRNAIRTADWSLVLDKRWAQPVSYYAELGPKLGQPEKYLVNYNAGRSFRTFTVHETRCVRFSGVEVDLRRRAELGGWDQSVLQRPYDVARQFAAAWQGAAAMLGDASQGIFEIKGLTQMLGNKEAAKLLARLTMVDMTRSAARSMVIDKETEAFSRSSQSFAGVPEMLDRWMQRLSAAVKIPVAILMGRSAAGMNATGDLDIKSWEKQVAAYQTRKLTRPIMQTIDLLSLSKSSPSGGKPLPGLGLKWNPLSQPSTKEEADTRLSVANADAVYLDRGVYTPEQVAIARSGRGEWSMDAPKVDVEALEAAMKATSTFKDPNVESETPDTTSEAEPGISGESAESDQSKQGANASD